ncbi:SHOCT domain-containing protein [Kocuria sediminis]|uniref:SHOCT domain-containing protein n=1 Tax=Kocuria sediminis TaxID=1038857 RepID=A0A6N8GLT8_9MICC|nr:SHOCT domain-containing protein [Kocuria sediminis]MUN64086.1 SHOCT domain-containing protein [Kocuria sediminis]
MDFWDVFVLMLIWVPLFLVWGMALHDIFRRDDIRGAMKAVWTLVVIFLPFLGTLIYLVVRPAGATEQERQAIDTASRQFVARYAPTDNAQQLALLTDLRDRGALTAQEFEAEKARVLGQAAPGRAPAEPAL